MPEFVVVIEHLEPCINKWILKEYEYVSRVYGSRLMITNVKDENHLRILSKYFQIITKESVTEILRDLNEVIVLDPKARKTLESSELKSVKYVIIGGIMGSHPPKSRTWLYITSKLPKAKPRNIGPYQYTIAGTAYVLRQIEEGKNVSDIKLIYGLSLKKIMSGIELEILLPYAFPVDDEGKVVLPNDYLRIVVEHMPIYEHRILISGENRICYNG
ncbi:MAG: SAM-dependent methyltransferase [Ignisphaera sp.]